jgi:hypothetical protein
MSFIAVFLNWPFVVLFFVTLNKSYEEHPFTGSVRSAMRYSVFAMIAPGALKTQLSLPRQPYYLNRPGDIDIRCLPITKLSAPIATPAFNPARVKNRASVP